MQTPLVENRPDGRRVHVSREKLPSPSPDECPVSGTLAVLDLPEIRARVLPLSVKAYEALGDLGLLDHRVELLRGVLVKKMPKSPLHRKLTKRIYDHCRDRRPAAHVVFQEAPLRLGDSEPEPDVMIVRGEESDFDNGHPITAVLIVEVAVSSEVLDREKASIYAEAGVTEYWIVLAEENQVEVYRQPENGVYQSKQLYAVGETVTCESVSDLRVALAEWLA